MTATAVSRLKRRSDRGLKGLAGVLGFVCLVLFLMVIEQKQAMDAWIWARDSLTPTARRVVGWAAGGATDGLDGLQSAASGDDMPLTATANAVVLAGTFTPADEATRHTVGSATFAGALIRLERGETIRTRPLRIASGAEVFNTGRETFAARLNAGADAQIELRAVIPHDREAVVPATLLCGGARPGVVAVLHRRDHVELMMFRERTIVGAETPPDALCGVWRFRAG
ncbi:hypothetical protein [Brevundimonas sp. FT23042]|uniref:hypothetical protein n=1 Tax=Brevundimonas sp. FT23042 TaxID=3393749 RepID=UPI003B585BE5